MAVPKIVVFFQWLRGKHGVESPILHDMTFTSNLLDEFINLSAENEKEFLRTQRLKALNQPISKNELKSVWFDAKEDYDSLQNLIGFIRANPHSQPLQVILAFMMRNPEIAAHSTQAFSLLFSAWLKLNPVDAIAWYEDEPTWYQDKAASEAFLAAIIEAHLVLGKLVVEHYLIETRVLFQNVLNPMGLIPLFAEYYENPQRIAAFIVHLLEKGSTNEMRDNITIRIIKSQLLHDFFMSHACFMDKNIKNQHDNAIKQLYRLLNTFDSAKPLVLHARNISVMTQSDLRLAVSDESRQLGVSAKRYFESYALDGCQQNGTNRLKIINTHPVTFNFIPNFTDFNPIYRLFGQKLLIKLLGLCGLGRDPAVRKILVYQLNLHDSQGVTLQELAKLLNTLVGEHNDLLLEEVAFLLYDVTLESLIESGNFAVFHLIPFYPDLLKKLDLNKVHRYIETLKPSHISFDQLALLRTIWVNLGNQVAVNELVALLFEKIVQVLMNHPDWSDQSLMALLQYLTQELKFQQLLQNQATQLSLQWNQSVQTVMIAAGGLNQDRLQVLKDEWLTSSRKSSVLRDISEKVTCDLPQDKYALYVSLVKVTLAHQMPECNLQAILSCLFSEDEEALLKPSSPDTVSERERILIELLSSIDNEALKSQAIQLLEGHPINRLNWINKDYGGKTIIELATQRRNNALVQYLLKKNRLTNAASSRLLKIATIEANWEIVKNLLHENNPNKPDKDSIMAALAAATKSDKLAWLLVHRASSFVLFQAAQINFSLPVEPGSLLASLCAHGEQETIKQLMQLSPELLQSLVTKTDITDYSGRRFPSISAFSYALWAQDWHMWTMMLDSLSEAFNKGYLGAETVRQEMLKQYMDLVCQPNGGVDYDLNGERIYQENHFNLQPLINALGIYIFNRCTDCWQTEIGVEQRKLPLAMAGEYCRAMPFHAERQFNQAERPPFPVFYNQLTGHTEAWFTLRTQGDDLAILGSLAYNGFARGYRNIDAMFIHEKDIELNLVALSILREVARKKVNQLLDRLAIPLQTQTLYGSDKRLSV